MTDRPGGKQLHVPVDAARIVTILAFVWGTLQVVGIIVGLTLVGRDGEGPMSHLDASVHDWFITHRSGLIGPAKVAMVAFDAPKLGVIVVVATVCALVWAWRRGAARWSTLGPLVAYFGAEATVYVVRLVIHRPRPASADFPGPDALAGIHETSWSFPSGHATGSMAVLVALAGLLVIRHRRKWIFAVAVVLAALVAVSRLVLGVHWMSDVASGAVLGGAWGAVVCWAEYRTADEPIMVDGADGTDAGSSSDPMTTVRSAP